MNLQPSRATYLIHASDSKSLSEMLYLVQPDKDDSETKLNKCDHTYSNPNCHCNVKVTLDTKFDLPWPNDDNFVSDKNGALPTHSRDHKNGYDIVNSCNGLLCLSHRTDHLLVVICNPVTREFVDLPRVKVFQYGFGFSNVSRQYKVVRFTNFNHLERSPRFRITAQVHIVGAKSWRDISSRFKHVAYPKPTYLNGFLYWFRSSTPISLLSFDIENEIFKVELGPKLDQPYAYKFVGVLGGELCITGVAETGTFYVWAMKDHGVENMWSMLFAIDMCYLRGCLLFKPLKYLDDGSLMLFYSYSNNLALIDRKKCTFRFLKICGKEETVKGMVAHIPSLKHSLLGHNVKVSRGKELKSHKHITDLQIIEELPAEYQGYHPLFG